MNTGQIRRIGVLLVLAAMLAILTGCDTIADTGVKGKGPLPEIVTENKGDTGQKPDRETGAKPGITTEPIDTPVPVQSPEVELDLVEYTHTRWYLQGQGGERPELLYIVGLGGRGITFDLQVPGRPGPVAIETDGSFGHTDTELIDSFEFVLNAPDEPGGSIRGNIRLQAGGLSVTLEVEAADGVFAPCIGSHRLVNAADDYYVLRDLYKSLLAEQVANGNTEAYYLYDIDSDGIPELIIKQGTSEADYMFDVYTVTRSGLMPVGSMSASNSILYYSDFLGLCRLWAHMDDQKFYRYQIKDGKLVETLGGEDFQEQPGGGYIYPFDGELAYQAASDSGLVEVYVCGQVASDFLYLYSQGDYDAMLDLVGGGLAGSDFSRGVFGLDVSLPSCCLLVGDPSDFHASDDMLVMYWVEVQIMQEPRTRAIPPWDEAGFAIILQEIGGEFRIVEFRPQV